MNEIKLKSYAKINLCLNVIRRLPNNYHQISSLIQRVQLYDEVHVKKNEKTITVRTNIDELNDEIDTNTALRAAKYYFKYTNICSGADILIIKHIPHMAGLGGSSSNAAAVINALDRLYNTKLTYDEKMSIGIRIGCDVPFFFGSATSVIAGTGEHITQKNELRGYHVLIIKPSFGISTKEAYKSLDPKQLHMNCNADNLYEAYAQKNYDIIKEYTHNTFERFIGQREYVCTIKNELLKYNAITALMSGSGSCVFGIFASEEKCNKAYNNLKKKYGKIYQTIFG
jgi:4-diphosphocytidyl-2-C-methyl-D-erythritol kinase